MKDIYLRYFVVAAITAVVAVLIDRWLIRRNTNVVKASDLMEPETVDQFIARSYPGASRVS